MTKEVKKISEKTAGRRSLISIKRTAEKKLTECA